MTTEHDLPPLPEPIGLGLLRYPYDEDDMRSYAKTAVERERKIWAARFETTEKSLATLAAIKARREVRTAWLLLSDMTDEQRLEVFRRFCTQCGSKDRACYCWNDE